MRRSAKSRRGCVWALIGAAALVALVPWQCVIWDARFPDVECRLKFVDGDGKPLSGVTLAVLTKGGTVSHFYPVDEFVPDQPVVSDAEGRIVFHHSAHYLEFGGRSYQNLIGLGWSEGSPRYDCVFTKEGREVFRTPFVLHHPEWAAYREDDQTRDWSPPWDEKRHGPRPGEDFGDWELRLFGRPRAEMDREERIAAGNFTRRFFRVGRPDPTRFIVVGRTIVISNP